MNYLTNSFSINMLNDNGALVQFSKVDASFVANYLSMWEYTSAIGHEDTARLVGNILGFEVKPNRITVKLNDCDMVFVAQYSGPRLPEGATELPEGAKIEFWLVDVLEPE